MCKRNSATWINIAQVSIDPSQKKAKTFSPAPFIFGPWTTTSYCNASCGTNRFKLELRTCTPISPNLPANISCQNETTLQTGNSTCPQSNIDCTGKIEHIKKRSKSANVTFRSGDVEQWSSWSDCEANCSQSLQAYRSLQRITGERSRNRSHTINSESVIETQTQPCTPDCSSG